MKYAILATLALVTVSCQSLSFLGKPDAAYVAAAELFAETVNTAADARDAGLLDEDRLRRVDANIQAGYRILTDWRGALDTGADTEDFGPILLATVRRINEYVNKER